MVELSCGCWGGKLLPEGGSALAGRQLFWFVVCPAFNTDVDVAVAL